MVWTPPQEYVALLFSASYPPKSVFWPESLPIRAEPKNITAVAAAYAPQAPAANALPNPASQPPLAIPKDTTDRAMAATIPKIPLPPFPPFSMTG